MTVADERQALQDFGDRYRTQQSPAADRVEQRVLGDVWGANGYTTVAEADVLGERLALGPGDRLLDVGAGRGWPGLYLARQTGCSVVATDLPWEGLAVAADRAGREGIAGRTGAVAATAGAPPFRPASFDAVVHTDVLC